MGLFVVYLFHPLQPGSPGTDAAPVVYRYLVDQKSKSWLSHYRPPSNWQRYS